MIKIDAKYRGQLYLFAATLLLPLLIYQLSLSKTFKIGVDIQRERSIIERVRLSNRDLPSQEIYREEKEPIELSQFLSNSAKELLCKLESYTPYKPAISSELDRKSAIFTSEVILSGGYISLVKMVQRVENERTFWKIAAADFKMVRLPARRAESQLQLILIIQYLKL